jgi:ABC-2 type transport system permease protein
VKAAVRAVRTSAWLGWQIESNWADPLVFVVYSVSRPLALALILVAVYWAVGSQATGAHRFLGFFVANAFHAYVMNVAVGLGWVVVEEREEYETLRSLVVAPMGMYAYFTGRGLVRLALATLSMVLTLTVGWFLLHQRWDWSAVRWAPLILAYVLGLIATMGFGFLAAGLGLLLPRVSITINEGLTVLLYLLCGVTFPIDLLPHGLQELSLMMPFTWWYEALRRFLLGAGASVRLGALSDGALLLGLAVTTTACVAVGLWGYRALEHRARSLGRIDQTTLF